MPSNFTANYNLSQWERADRVRMEDFNSDNAKIDAAIKAVDTKANTKASQSALNAEVSARTALAALVDKKGNCRMETQSYTGNGKCGASSPTVIAFPAIPDYFIIFGDRSVAMGFGGEDYITSITYTSSQSYSFHCGQQLVTWNSSTMSFQTGYEESQLNKTNAIYHVVSFYKMDGR